MLPDEKVQFPVIRRPVGKVLLVEGDEPVEEIGLANAIGPGDRERHLVRRVDALLRNPSEPEELVVRSKPQLQPRRSYAQLVEGMYLHAACLPGGATGVGHRERAGVGGCGRRNRPTPR